MNKSKQWPEDYQNWSGSFDELVDTARAIQSEWAPTEKLLNPRLVRHYQSVGAVGRGVREGRSSRFYFSDLAALMATKSLVKEGWTLSNAAPFATSMSAPTLATMTSSYGYSHAEPELPNDTAASRLVRELMFKSSPASPESPSFLGAANVMTRGLPRHVRASAALASGLVSPTSVAGASHKASPSPPVDEVVIVPWLTLTFDPSALSTATPEDRQLASQNLSAWSKSHLD